MKIARWLFALIVALCVPIRWTPQAAPQADRKACRIVDAVITKSGEVDYVDGTRVPSELGVLGFLREREKVSPCNCLLAFFTVTARIRDIEDLRVIAGKMDYQEFHAYLHEDRYRDFATEILYYGPHLKLDELRSGSHGPVPLPDHEPAKK